uniref:Uncharacterized protein n=1 Tax=Picea sitchensis TaxID=3332 RepID=A0A6B9XQZ8_PICSI|nr:hypothetical protein Q903MT_gene5575 [Picea sitchensis]
MPLSQPTFAPGIGSSTAVLLGMGKRAKLPSRDPRRGYGWLSSSI